MALLMAAWEHFYQRGDGTEGGTDCISLAVKAIETMLVYDGELQAIYRDGRFTRRTKYAVRRFQRDEGLTRDGVVGPKTAKHLFFPLIDETERELEIPHNFLFGLLYHESRLDPGVIAENKDGSRDRYLAQINEATTYDGSTKTDPISDVDAADPGFSIPYAGERLRKAFDKFKRWDCAILSHNSPVNAAKLHAGQPIDERYVTYIARVKAAAKEVPS